MNKKFKVLVVDDSLTIRKIIRSELEKNGYEVIEAEDGVQALLKATSADSIDLVTLDMDMPNLDGFSTCKKLHEDKLSKFITKSEGDKVPIIFVTGNDNLEDRKKGFELGAMDFIVKPFDEGELATAVDKILKPKAQLQDLTVLIVDDSKTARTILKTILVREGVTILEAQTGIHAFEMVCRHMAGIDIIITDLMMPSMNGDEFCKKVRTELNLKDIPIIFLTGFSEQSQLLELFKIGGTDYIVKPFVKEELLARIKVHLERAKLYKRLRSNVKELRSLNTMKDNLLSVCSHDLRTPLNSILGCAELMLGNKNLLEDDKENLEDIKTSGELLLGLINDILDLSKVRSTEVDMEMKIVYPNEIMKDSFRAMKYMAEKKDQHIELVTNSTNECILGNRTGLIRVLNNLLSNSIKFTPENGNIKVSKRTGSDDYLIISVSDDGVGIPEEEIPALFDKFTKISHTGTGGEVGTGLGMSIVKEIIEMHDGSVEVISSPGKGTTFELLLPILKSKVHERNADEKDEIMLYELKSEPVEDKLRSLKILLAEDNQLNIRVAEKMLMNKGHVVTVAENGNQAVAAVQNENFDAILMDVQMPEKNGLEATVEIRNKGYKLPIIALTASDDQENVDACINAGMDDVLTKPVKADDIQSKLLIWCE